MKELIAAILAGSALGWVAIPHCYAMCGPLHIFTMKNPRLEAGFSFNQKKCCH
jgi:sulfite exporter TauE/SafE